MLDIFTTDRLTPSFRRPFSSLPSESVSPSLLRTLEAAARQENLAGALLSKVGRTNTNEWIRSFWDQDPIQDDPDFDAWKTIAGTRYEDYAREFAKARSKDDVLSIVRDIDLETADRQVLADAGGWGVMSVLMAGALDPINLIPFGGAASRISKIPGMLRRLAVGAAAQTSIGGITSAAQEIGLGALQKTRTREEMLMGITGGAFLSGLLGGAASLLPAPVEKFGKKAFLDWQGRNLQEVKTELLRQGGAYSRQDFRNDLVWEWDLSPEQVDAALAHFDATVLKQWSDKSGVPVDQFYKSHLGQVAGLTSDELDIDNILDDFGRRLDPDYLAAEMWNDAEIERARNIANHPENYSKNQVALAKSVLEESTRREGQLIAGIGQEKLFKAATDFNYREDGRAILAGLKGSVDLSSLLHEFVHVWRRSLTPEQAKGLGNFFNVEDGKWTVEAEEAVVSAVESLFFDGKTTRPVPETAKPQLDRFRTWLMEVWGRLRYTPVANETNPELRSALERYWMPWEEAQKGAKARTVLTMKQWVGRALGNQQVFIGVGGGGLSGEFLYHASEAKKAYKSMRSVRGRTVAKGQYRYDPKRFSEFFPAFHSRQLTANPKNENAITLESLFLRFTNDFPDFYRETEGNLDKDLQERKIAEFMDMLSSKFDQEIQFGKTEEILKKEEEAALSQEILSALKKDFPEELQAYETSGKPAVDWFDDLPDKTKNEIAAYAVHSSLVDRMENEFGVRRIDELGRKLEEQGMDDERIGMVMEPYMLLQETQNVIRDAKGNILFQRKPEDVARETIPRLFQLNPELYLNRSRFDQGLLLFQKEDVSKVLTKEQRETLDKNAVRIDPQFFGKIGTPIYILREKARKYYRENLQGTTVENPFLGEIQFTGGGSKKAFSASADIRKIKAFASLREMIQKGILLYSKEPTDQNIETNVRKYHRLLTKAVVNGEDTYFGIVIKEDSNGNLYYNHVVWDLEKEKSSKGYPGVITEGDRTTPAINEDSSTQTIQPSDTDVNKNSPETLFQKLQRSEYGLEPIPWVPDFAVKWAAKLGPGARLFTTQYSDAAGKMAEKLISMSVYLGKHWEGRSTELPPVEIRVSKQINQVYSEAKKAMLDSFVKYRARIAGEKTPSEARFTQVMRMRAGDYLQKRMGNQVMDEKDFRRLIYDAWGGKDTGIPEVQAAAATVRKVMDDLGRELSAQGLLPDDLKAPLEKGFGHRPRIYRPHVVEEYGRTFRDIVRARAAAGEVGDKARPIEEIANDITNSFNGHLWYDVGKIDPNNLEELEKEKARFLHHRVLNFDDQFLIGVDIYDESGKVVDTVDFIETDPDRILKTYLRSVVPDLELKKQFGSIDLIDQFKEVLANYDQRIDNTKGSTGKIEKEKRDVLQDLVALRDRIRGTDRFNGDPRNPLRRINNAIMRLNGTLYLGNVLLSSFADPGRAVMRYGLAPFAKALSSVVGDAEKWKAFRGWERTIGAATDVLTNESSRYLEFADLHEPIRRNSWAEEKIEFLSDQFGWLSGLEIWTNKWKELTGLMSSHFILDRARKIKDAYNAKEITFKADGTIEGNAPIDQKEIQQLAQMGFTARELMDVAGEFSKHGDKENVDLLLPQTQKWTNAAVRDKFEAAIIQEMNNVIVTPTMGDRPLMASSPWGAMFLQFKSFTLASMQKVMLAGLQQRDKNVVQGALAMTMLGAMSYYAKQLSRGNTPTTEPDELLVEAIDNAGLLGVFGDINGFIELMSGGRTGLHPMVGEGVMSRYRSRDVLDVLAGPTGSTIKQAVTGIAKPALTLDVTDQNLYSLNKIVPYSQMWYWRWLGESLREGMVNELGLDRAGGEARTGTEG